jgi:hypothetical protein
MTTEDGWTCNGYGESESTELVTRNTLNLLKE